MRFTTKIQTNLARTMILNPFKLLKLGKKPSTPRKKLEIPSSPEQLIKKHGRLANQGELVMKSMQMIQESILDNDALQGYESLPEQITRIMYEVFGIMALNEEFTTPEEVFDVWMESYIDGWVELELED